jgi:hypothetical protein
MNYGLKKIQVIYQQNDLLYLMKFKRKQQRNFTKFYSIDPALARRVSIPGDNRDGYYLENLIFLELIRREYKVYYWDHEQKAEIDFVAEGKDGDLILVQSCWSIGEEKTLARELAPFKFFFEMH